jgi:hypothetical protein
MVLMLQADESSFTPEDWALPNINNAESRKLSSTHLPTDHPTMMTIELCDGPVCRASCDTSIDISLVSAGCFTTVLFVPRGKDIN